MVSFGNWTCKIPSLTSWWHHKPQTRVFDQLEWNLYLFTRQSERSRLLTVEDQRIRTIAKEAFMLTLISRLTCLQVDDIQYGCIGSTTRRYPWNNGTLHCDVYFFLGSWWSIRINIRWKLPAEIFLWRYKMAISDCSMSSPFHCCTHGRKQLLTCFKNSRQGMHNRTHSFCISLYDEAALGSE